LFPRGNALTVNPLQNLPRTELGQISFGNSLGQFLVVEIEERGRLGLGHADIAEWRAGFPMGEEES
jgi:hypothetical protein